MNIHNTWHAIDWTKIPARVEVGGLGTATERSWQRGDVCLRMIEFSAHYAAPEWCSKGHVLYVVVGSLVIETQDGGEQLLTEGMTYLVSGGEVSRHRAKTAVGARVFVVD